jgi:lysophospholipase L1-like esterase
MPGRLSRIAERAALLLASAAVALGLGELAVRAFLPAPRLVNIRPDPDAARRRNAENARRFEFSLPTNPDQGLYVWTKAGPRIRANIAVVIESHSISGRRVEIVSNSLGYRNRELGPPEERRLLFLGDSITFADYLPDEETFVRQVEALSRARGDHWETVNAGIGGAGIHDELAILEETGLGIRPDAVILNFFLNDFVEGPGIFIRKPPPFLRRSWLAYHLFTKVFYHLDSFWLRRGRSFARREDDPAFWRDEYAAAHPAGDGDWTRDTAAFDRIVLGAFDDWGGAWSPRAWEYLRPIFAELKRLTEAGGVKVLIIAHPVRQQVEAAFLRDYPQRQLAAIAADLGIPLLDLLPIMRETRRDSAYPLFYDHCHHTSAGSRLVAAQVYRFLKTQGL